MLWHWWSHRRGLSDISQAQKGRSCPVSPSGAPRGDSVELRSLGSGADGTGQQPGSGGRDSVRDDENVCPAGVMMAQLRECASRRQVVH